MNGTPSAKLRIAATGLTLALVLVSAGSAVAREVKPAAARLYDDAARAVAREDWDAARRILEDAIASYPDSGSASSGMMTSPYYPYYLLGVVIEEVTEVSVVPSVTS